MRGVDEGGKGGVLLCVELEGCRASQLRSADTIDDRALYFCAKFQTVRQVLRFRGRRGEEKGYMVSRPSLCTEDRGEGIQAAAVPFCVVEMSARPVRTGWCPSANASPADMPS